MDQAADRYGNDLSPGVPLLSVDEHEEDTSSPNQQSINSTASPQATPAARPGRIAASRMRANLITRIWRELQSSRVSIAFYAISFLVQVTACITVLVMERDDACDTPLRLFLSVQAVRLFLSTPLHIYRQLYAPPPTDGDVVQEASMADRFLSLLEFFGVIWFVTGNWWLFTSQSCNESSPLVYYLSVIFVIIGYCIVLFPLLLCVGMICCFPCVLIAMRYVDKEPRNGASTTQIRAIPVETFKTGSIPAEDAMCAICLAEYVDEELIKRLQCNHHFHSKCVDDWLPLSKNCPLCMRKIDEPLEGDIHALDDDADSHV